MANTATERESSHIFGTQLGNDMVDIFVGLDKQYFHVHKSVLVSHSKYFKAMFTGGFKETKGKSATLLEDDPVVFSAFLQWVYGGKRLAPVIMQPGTAVPPDFIPRIELYGFAEKYCITELTDYIMTNIMSTLCHYEPDVEEIVAAYENTRSKSPLRAFMSDNLYFIAKVAPEESYWSSSRIGDGINRNGDLATDFILLFKKHDGKGVRRPSKQPKCTYHTHAEGAECAFKDEIL